MVHKTARKNASKLINDIREALYNNSLREVEEAFARQGIELFTKCTGEAHSRPADYDNCMVCAPHWGISGLEVKVT